MTAVTVMIISTLLFSCSCQVKQGPGDFSKWNPPHPECWKVRLSLFTCTHNFCGLQTTGLTTKGQLASVSGSNVPDSWSSPRPSLSAEPSWPEQSAPTSIRPCEPQHCWECWLYAGTTAKETRLPSDVQPCEKLHAVDMISHLWKWLKKLSVNVVEEMGGLTRISKGRDRKTIISVWRHLLERTLLSAISPSLRGTLTYWGMAPYGRICTPRSCHLTMAD